MKKVTFIYVLLFIIALAATANAQISVVVSSSSSQTANEAQIKEIFSGTSLNWPDGSKTAVVEQAKTDTGKTFYSKFIKKFPTQVQKKWMKLVLSGQANAPVKCADDSAVKLAVAKDKNTIGYIKTSALDGTVKEIHKIQ